MNDARKAMESLQELRDDTRTGLQGQFPLLTVIFALTML
jgi:hypothetical protein